MNPLASQKKTWILTQDAFDQLLSAFAADRESAAQRYEIIRRKLSEFFEARGNDSPPDRVDETINRVARRIAEGEQIKDLNAYFYGVARLVWLENLRARDKERPSRRIQRNSKLNSTSASSVSRVSKPVCQGFRLPTAL